MIKYIVYLSSTSYHWWNFRSKNWKKNLIYEISKRNKPINFIDPLQFKSEDPLVCPLDLKDIDRSNYIAIYIDKISIGTMLELGYCIYNGLKFGVLSFNKNVLNHPWIKYLCKDAIFTDYKSMSDIILMDYKLSTMPRISNASKEKDRNNR